MEKTEATPPKPAEPVSEPNPLYQMEELVAKLQKMMGPLLDSTAIPAESREQMEAIFRLLKLVSFYGRETTKCLGASAFFAANVMGAATLETLLLVMCIMNETGVRSTNTWRNVLKGKGKPFLRVLGRADLEKVLQVGSELSWFSNADLPKLFQEHVVKHFGQEASTVICNAMPKGGRLSADVARDARNRLHPAKSIREPFELSDSTGMLASLCLLLALSSVVQQNLDSRTS
jgi:hypothetical protein